MGKAYQKRRRTLQASIRKNYNSRIASAAAPKLNIKQRVQMRDWRPIRGGAHSCKAGGREMEPGTALLAANVMFEQSTCCIGGNDISPVSGLVAREIGNRRLATWMPAATSSSLLGTIAPQAASCKLLMLLL